MILLSTRNCKGVMDSVEAVGYYSFSTLQLSEILLSS